MRCLNLRQLCVSKCSELSDSTLLALANYNPHLSTLEVAGCNQFTDIGFQALGKVNKQKVLTMMLRTEKLTLRALLVELQILGANGFGRVQSNNRSDVGTLGNRMSKLGKTCSLQF